MNYSELKTNIADWLHRDDLTSKIDTFIDLFEARANRNLRTSEMEETSTSTPSDQYFALPADFLEVKHIKVAHSVPVILQYTDPATLRDYALAGGNAQFYSIIDNQIEIQPSAAGTSVTLIYYEKIPALSDSNTTNWLISQHEDYYLLGCKAEAFSYLHDWDNEARAIMRLNEMEAMINKRGKNRMYGRGPLIVMAS